MPSGMSFDRRSQQDEDTFMPCEHGFRYLPVFLPLGRMKKPHPVLDGFLLPLSSRDGGGRRRDVSITSPS